MLRVPQLDQRLLLERSCTAAVVESAAVVGPLDGADATDEEVVGCTPRVLATGGHGHRCTEHAAVAIELLEREAAARVHPARVAEEAAAAERAIRVGGQHELLIVPADALPVECGEVAGAVEAVDAFVAAGCQRGAQV